MILSSESSESSESLSELEDDDSLLDSKAFCNCEVNDCRILGVQQQHCQLDSCAFSKYSSPRFFFIQEVQNKFLHDLQLTKSPFFPHHPQKHSEHSGSCESIEFSKREKRKSIHLSFKCHQEYTKLK